MNKSTLALAVAVGVLAQQAGAAGFIEDSKATLGLRNFYINTDNRDSAAGTPANSKVSEKTKNGAKASTCVSSPATPKAPSASVSMPSACWVCVWIRAAALTATLPPIAP